MSAHKPANPKNPKEGTHISVACIMGLHIYIYIYCACVCFLVLFLGMCPHNLEGLFLCSRVIIFQKDSDRAGPPARDRIERSSFAGGSSNTTCVGTSCGAAASWRSQVIFPRGTASISNGRNSGGPQGGA